MAFSAQTSFTPDPGLTEATTLGMTRGARLAAEHGLRISRQRVPIEEGTLERSGVASVGELDGQPTGAVSYDTPYAVRQHEDLTLRHDAGRTAKYLERPLLEDRETLLRIIGEAVRATWKG